METIEESNYLEAFCKLQEDARVLDTPPFPFIVYFIALLKEMD